MDVFEAIHGRRSVRSFRKKDVSKEDVLKILDAARWAPSAGNLQPWEVIIIKNSETKAQRVWAAVGQSFIADAPVVLVVCVDCEKASAGYGTRGESLYCLQDSAAAIQNLLLAAHALELGTCWIGAFHEERVRKIFNLPQRYRPIAIIPIGHPTSKPSPTSRRNLERVTHLEKFEDIHR
ncbi:MAG: nitroreductase family protein [Candidatus Bathyarchaeota archaeon]